MTPSADASTVPAPATPTQRPAAAAPAATNLGTPAAPLPTLTVGATTVPLHLEDALKAELEKVMADIPEGKRGSVRCVVGMQGVSVVFGSQLGDHVQVAAQVGRDLKTGETSAGVGGTITWAP